MPLRSKMAGILDNITNNPSFLLRTVENNCGTHLIL
jgi:hypothetical protein